MPQTMTSSASSATPAQTQGPAPERVPGPAPTSAPPLASRYRPEDLLLALDIGSSRVACALAVLRSDGLRVLAAETAESYGIRDGEVVDLERAGEAIRIAAETVMERSGVRARRAVVGFSGPMRLCVARGNLPLSGGPRAVKRGDVAQLRRTLYADGGPSRRVVHRFDGPYAVGDLGGLEQPVGLSGPQLAMSSTFLTAPAVALDHLDQALRDAGLAAETVVLAPYAASRGVLTAEERNLGAAVLDLGAGAFRGVLWEGGRLRQLSVSNFERPAPPAGVTPAPGGMEGVVLALARRFRLTPATARQLIREHGQAGAGASAGLVRAIEAPALDGLGKVWVELDELARTLEELLVPPLRALRDGLPLFSAGHAGGVVLTGQGARLAGLDGLVSRHFGGAPVRLGVPRWASAQPLPRALEGPAGATLCGLLICGQEARAGRAARGGAWAWWQGLQAALRRAAAL